MAALLTSNRGLRRLATAGAMQQRYDALGRELDKLVGMYEPDPPAAALVDVAAADKALAEAQAALAKLWQDILAVPQQQAAGAAAPPAEPDTTAAFEEYDDAPAIVSKLRDGALAPETRTLLDQLGAMWTFLVGVARVPRRSWQDYLVQYQALKVLTLPGVKAYYATMVAMLGRDLEQLLRYLLPDEAQQADDAEAAGDQLELMAYYYALHAPSAWAGKPDVEDTWAHTVGQLADGFLSDLDTRGSLARVAGNYDDATAQLTDPPSSQWIEQLADIQGQLADQTPGAAAATASRRTASKSDIAAARRDRLRPLARDLLLQQGSRWKGSAAALFGRLRTLLASARRRETACLPAGGAAKFLDGAMASAVTGNPAEEFLGSAGVVPDQARTTKGMTESAAVAHARLAARDGTAPSSARLVLRSESGGAIGCDPPYGQALSEGAWLRPDPEDSWAVARSRPATGALLEPWGLLQPYFDYRGRSNALPAARHSRMWPARDGTGLWEPTAGARRAAKTPGAEDPFYLRPAAELLGVSQARTTDAGAGQHGGGPEADDVVLVYDQLVGRPAEWLVARGPVLPLIPRSGNTAVGQQAHAAGVLILELAPLGRVTSNNKPSAATVFPLPGGQGEYRGGGVRAVALDDYLGRGEADPVYPDFYWVGSDTPASLQGHLGHLAPMLDEMRAFSRRDNMSWHQLMRLLNPLVFDWRTAVIRPRLDGGGGMLPPGPLRPREAAGGPPTPVVGSMWLADPSLVRRHYARALAQHTGPPSWLANRGTMVSVFVDLCGLAAARVLLAELMGERQLLLVMYKHRTWRLLATAAAFSDAGLQELYDDEQRMFVAYGIERGPLTRWWDTVMYGVHAQFWRLVTLWTDAHARYAAPPPAAADDNDNFVSYAKRILKDRPFMDFVGPAPVFELSNDEVKRLKLSDLRTAVMAHKAQTEQSLDTVLDEDDYPAANVPLDDVAVATAVLNATERALTKLDERLAKVVKLTDTARTSGTRLTRLATAEDF
jgi:hypothetical protein